MDNPPTEQSNAGAFYQARFEAVCNAFQAEDVHGETYRNACIQLLAEERCPLTYRVILQYMISHTADDPAIELREALHYLDTLDEMVESGAVEASPWFANARSFLDEMLEACRTPPNEVYSDSEKDSEDGSEEAAENAGEAKEFDEGKDDIGPSATTSFAESVFDTPELALPKTPKLEIGSSDLTTVVGSDDIRARLPSSPVEPPQKRARDSSSEGTDNSDAHVAKKQV